MPPLLRRRAIDALLQARNLDRIILLTGDGDFLRLVVALQNMGSRVEVIGFHNVSGELREVADAYMSGFLIPGLLPITPYSGNDGQEQWQRGVVANFNIDRGFGFFRYYRMIDSVPKSETVFFHLSKSTLGSDQYFQVPGRIFEFKVVHNPANNNRPEAWDIRLLKES